MTRFGPMERMKDVFQVIGDAPPFFKFNCAPYVLAPLSRAQLAATSLHASSQQTLFAANAAKLPLLLCPEGERVLLVAYCLLPAAADYGMQPDDCSSEWLCAAATDERGALLDTALINISAPQLPPPAQGKEWRPRQRHSQIADALQRLWQFAQSVMLQQEVRNWRLVSFLECLLLHYRGSQRGKVRREQMKY